MSLFPLSPASVAVPVFNSACPWASSAEDLTALYECPYTSAVTTRTATLKGFADDQTKHQVSLGSVGVLRPGCAVDSEVRKC